MKCSFCGNEIEKGTGKIFAKTSGKILFFCSTKCEKNMLKLGRKPRLVEWTDEHIKGVADAAAKKALKSKKNDEEPTEVDEE